MEQTQTYTLEVCADGLGILSGTDDHTVVRVTRREAGVEVTALAATTTLSEAWEMLHTVRQMRTARPALPE